MKNTFKIVLVLFTFTLVNYTSAQIIADDMLELNAKTVLKLHADNSITLEFFTSFTQWNKRLLDIATALAEQGGQESNIDSLILLIDFNTKLITQYVIDNQGTINYYSFQKLMELQNDAKTAARNAVKSRGIRMESITTEFARYQKSFLSHSQFRLRSL
jgi:hypothetical protein